MIRLKKNSISLQLSFFAFLSIVLLAFNSATSLAQSSQQKPQPQPQVRPNEVMSAEKGAPTEDTTPLTTFEEEMKAKRAIKLAEKEHEENVSRGREISQLAREVQEDIKKRPVLDRDQLKKIDRLEKLTKKIRGEAGGEDSETTVPDQPADLVATVKRITDVAETLSKSVQNTPRQVVSACVIDNANVLLELLKVVRTFSR